MPTRRSRTSLFPIGRKVLCSHSSEPALKNGVWPVGTLAAGTEGQITFRGVIGA